jgi:hypothetical protein
VGWALGTTLAFTTGASRAMLGNCGGALATCLANSWRRGALRARCGWAGGGALGWGGTVGSGGGTVGGGLGAGGSVGGVVGRRWGSAASGGATVGSGGATVGTGWAVAAVATAACGCARVSVTLSDSLELAPAIVAGSNRIPKKSTSKQCNSNDSA